MTAAPQPFERFRTVLQESADAVEALLTLALEQQKALVSSDFAAVERTTRQMDGLSTILDQLDQRRVAALVAAGCGAATLSEAVAMASETGLERIDELAAELAETTVALREVQERNAHLILNGTHMIGRLVDVIAGVTESTYGSEGRREAAGNRRFISRSA